MPPPPSTVTEVLGLDRLHGALAGARLVVLALALTPETTGIIGAPELDRMDGEAWLVNVARSASAPTSPATGGGSGCSGSSTPSWAIEPAACAGGSR